ncbi:MAG TPA: bifunctional YncE family protein/alkaline phosphatase family protein [Candidatus Angelobacter sp.]|nr:bifunctional YncE family protein/alkaline phosphatase family protein [Candidatus Angelobacter sp.]
MSITPLAARGVTLQPLNPDLPDLPQFTADHPLTTALSPDGKTLLIVTSGFNRNNDTKGKAIPEQSNEYVFVYDVRRPTPVKQQVLALANAYAGLAWAPDGKTFYVSGGVSDNVHVVSESDGRWAESATIPLGHQAGLGVPSMHEGEVTPIHAIAAGLSVNGSGSRLLVANHQNDSVSLIDTATRAKIAELDLRPGIHDPPKKGVAGGEYPYWTVFKGDDKGYVSSLRDREIVVLDLRAAPVIAGRIKVRGQPGKMILNRAQNLLFAVADNSDSVVIVDTNTDRVVAEIKTTAPAAVFPNRSGFKGSNPTGLALSPDEKTLYVTNGGTNSVAVIRLDRDLEESRVVGLIPTAWYPNAVSVSRDGSVLYVVNGRSNAGPNPKGCRNNLLITGDRPCATAQQYIFQLEKGGLATIPRPSPVELQALTAQVARNNHFNSPTQARQKQNADRMFSFLRSKIKHVIYIVKENRTYDQVLGDLEKGNGDPALNLFPEALAPNHHELARRFVTLDNFFDSGEVSGDGWNWSTAARATDFTERTIAVHYANRGFTYDFEGTNREINVGGISSQERNTAKLDDPDDQLPGAADVAAPDGPSDETGAGYLWDSALRARLTVRNYGFFVDLIHYGDLPNEVPIPLLREPAATHTRVVIPTNPRLQDYTDPYFRSFDMKFPDYWRFKEWEREFDEFVRQNNLPALELLRICHDHFGSFKDAIDGVNTVETQLADNDYALGLVVEKVAHSKYAASTLIFVIEDDAQNGPDHVDAHRSLAYVIGPYVKQGAVISVRYTTVSVLRTIGEILGTGPLGLFDALQPPMTEVFSATQPAWNYSARVPTVLRTTQLPVPAAAGEEKAAVPRRDAAYWTENTRDFDFSREDRLDSARFNLVLWNGLKSEGQPYPSERDGRDLSKDRQRLLRQAGGQARH